MDISFVHHTGFTVRDLDRSVAFYRDLLGCTVILEQEKSGGYLAAIVGYPDARVRMVQLHDPGERHVIELFEYLSPQVLEVPLEPRQIGNAHLCFVVDDLENIYSALTATGVEFLSSPVTVDTGANRGGQAVYLRDPDGITLELFQPATMPAREVDVAGSA